jgi:hypothetical protein
MSSDVDTVENIDIAIEELAIALGHELPPDCERGALLLACETLSDEFAMLPVRGHA